ncbi:putative DnaB-like helicase [Alteromonas phage vB_AmeP_R8W]|uniref:Putative DnaB-like helicase n=1 Tax=Alteromonas phage vB_AmeP_R8W TaxID=2774152 RepID=A0A8E4W6R8_9CAUD|nr:putative DnaB-like helicase [Alteromonas phage vB_AmeP_R8W]
MIDLALLRIIKYREQFDKVHRYIPKSSIDKKTRAITEDIRKYFESNPDEEKIDFPSFRSMFFTTWHKGLSDSDCDFYNKLIERMEEDVPESIKKNIINQLLELEFATNVGNVIEDYQAGEDIEVVASIDNLVSRIKESLERTSAFEFADFDDSTVGQESDDDGYNWPLKCMNDHYRKIQGGDQYIVAARPGKGKTTFLTHLNYAMSKQMPENKVIVWFNNESRRQRIMSRQIQSAMYMTNGELKQLQLQGKLREQYIKVMGSADRVRVYDIHGKNNFHLEEILEGIGLENVGAIVIDMLDNVKFPTLKDVREDQRLEQLYQWSRELGVKYNCPVFPTSQISNEGAGLMFPNENMLKDSKTGKQGACDGIIMIGSSDDPLLQNKRGLSMPKTKSKREGMPDMMEEITFDADKGRYL